MTAPAEAIARIGDLDLPYDPGRWQVTQSDAATRIICIDRDDCFGARILAGTAPDEGPESCSETAMQARLRLGPEDIGISIGKGLTSSRVVNGLVLYEATADIGCRNLAGGPVFACIHHAGTAYTFDAPGNHCHTHFGHERVVDDLLSGLRPH